MLYAKPIGAYSAIYFLNSTNHYQLAQSVLRRKDKLLDVDVELIDTTWLDELRFRQVHSLITYTDISIKIVA
jgi:hypothetical protein